MSSAPVDTAALAYLLATMAELNRALAAARKEAK